MPITNIYTPESEIIAGLQSLFAPNMIFPEARLEEVTEELFRGVAQNEDKVAALVINAGFKADPPAGNNRRPQQLLKAYWQIVVVCPIELYSAVGGVKLVEVINHFSGFELSAAGVGKMTLVDDERGFNRPDYLNDMAFIPALFQVKAVIGGP